MRTWTVVLVALLAVPMPTPASASWDHPAPVRRALPGDGIESFVGGAVLPLDKVSDEWRSAVRRHLPARVRTPVDTLRAVVAAMAEFNIRYAFGPAASPGQLAEIGTNLPPASEPLRSRLADCRQVTRLVAATLRELGQQVVVVANREHVIPAILGEGSGSVRVGPGLSVVPIDPTFTDHVPFDFEVASRDGREFVERAIAGPDAVVATLDGRILWRRGPDASFLLGGRPPDAPPPGAKHLRPDWGW